MRENFLATHAHGPLSGATAYLKGLTWNQAPHPNLTAIFQSSVSTAYWLSSVITVHRESAPWPLSYVTFLEHQRLSKTIAPGEVFAVGSHLPYALEQIFCNQCHEFGVASCGATGYAGSRVPRRQETSTSMEPLPARPFCNVGHNSSTGGPLGLVGLQDGNTLEYRLWFST